MHLHINSFGSYLHVRDELFEIRKKNEAGEVVRHQYAAHKLRGIVLGMGMPTTPAYIIMVSLLVPALIKLGAIEPAAHMFAFYFAILSAITPPVALAVFAAASLFFGTGDVSASPIALR